MHITYTNLGNLAILPAAPPVLRGPFPPSMGRENHGPSGKQQQGPARSREGNGAAGLLDGDLRLAQLGLPGI